MSEKQADRDVEREWTWERFRHLALHDPGFYACLMRYRRDVEDRVEAEWREMVARRDRDQDEGDGLGSCRICERPTDGVTVCRYCDRMMEHLDGVIGHHRDRVRKLAEEFEHKCKMQGSEFYRGKWKAFEDVLDAFPVTVKDQS